MHSQLVCRAWVAIMETTSKGVVGEKESKLWMEEPSFYYYTLAACLALTWSLLNVQFSRTQLFFCQ